ncbi:MAG: DUF4230 domain-containing protein [Polyangiaceae bacterium]
MALKLPLSRTQLVLATGIASLLLGISLAVWVALRPRPPLLPPLSSSVSVVKPLPSVLLAVRDLARLESVSFHMERVIDLTEKQSNLFGLVESQDAILLVAVADVSAGVDLARLQEGDVTVDKALRRARIRLPVAEIFHVGFDKEHTYVHTRKTDLLARRHEDLESRARAEAERALVDSAREAGILLKARENARRVVEGLVRSLGYERIEFVD